MSETTVLLDEVFCRHYDKMVAWCRSRVAADMEDPEDLVHSAYLRCSRCWSAELSSKGREAAYLYRALRWVLLDSLRARCRQKNRNCQGPRRRDKMPWIVLHQLVAQEALMSLGGRQLQVCSALLEGKSEKQIRGELQLTRGALAVYICRARARLSQVLGVTARRGRRPAQSAA